MADALGHGPEFAGPPGRQRRGGHHGEEVAFRGGRGERGGAVARMVVHQDDVEIAGRTCAASEPMARATTSASSRAGTTATMRGAEDG
jgi:hypothetical protein